MFSMRRAAAFGARVRRLWPSRRASQPSCLPNTPRSSARAPGAALCCAEGQPTLDDVRCAARHSLARAPQYELFGKLEKMLTLPLLVLTTVTGLLSALQSGLGVNSGKAISVIVAITGCLSALVHTLNQHFQLAARAEKCLGLSKSYQQVVSKIEAELNLMKCEAAAASPGARPGLPSLSEAKEGLAGALGKIPGFAAMSGEAAASPAAPAGSSSAAAAGPTTATKTKFLQMIQAEVAQLNGSFDDMPAALATVAEAAVGLAATTSCFGCFKRHKPVASGAAAAVGDVAEDAMEMLAPRAAASGAYSDAGYTHSQAGSAPPSRATSRRDAPSGARQGRPRATGGRGGDDRNKGDKGLEDVL